MILSRRHEKPVENELAKQNIQDRYHGHNDPVAHKILNSHAKNMGLTPPEDQAIVRALSAPLLTDTYECYTSDFDISDHIACFRYGRVSTNARRTLVTWC